MYKCPACSTRTCSAACVKSHKLSSGCTGERPPTEFVPAKQFNDQVLYRDFNFLEKTSSLLHTLKRTPKVDGLQKRALLKKEAYNRGVNLKTFPPQFMRAKTNTSHVRKRKGANEVWWKIEWRFLVSIENPVVFTDTCVPEDKILGELLRRFLDNTWTVGATKHQLLALEGLELDVSLATKPEEALDQGKTLKDLLVGKQVIEYPVFLIKPK
jgi:hypothetical protein